MITNSINELNERYSTRMSQYFPEPLEPSNKNLEVELNLIMQRKQH